MWIECCVMKCVNDAERVLEVGSDKKTMNSS